jgi:hypothetical protein
MPAAIAASSARPPITPPTIGPAGGELFWGVGVGVVDEDVVDLKVIVVDELGNGVLIVLLVFEVGPHGVKVRAISPK